MMKIALTTNPNVVITRLNLLLIPLLRLAEAVGGGEAEAEAEDEGKDDEGGSTPKTKWKPVTVANLGWERTLVFTMLEAIHVMCTALFAHPSFFLSSSFLSFLSFLFFSISSSFFLLPSSLLPLRMSE
jgi:hypothetical protein